MLISIIRLVSSIAIEIFTIYNTIFYFEKHFLKHFAQSFEDYTPAMLCEAT